MTATAAQQRAWRAWLSPQECARADRYLSPVHGERYLAAHAQLRWILAREMGCPPGAVCFRRDAHGKPGIAGAGLQFNLSHSGALGLVGVHPTMELGVDIEVERTRNFLGLAERYFTPAEQAWLREQPEAERAHAFARLWTCKEAWMKADGRGLAVLRQPEIALDGAAAALHAEGRAWWVHELALAPGCAAAVVMRAAPEAISVKRLPPPPLA